jgi:hypothetical protein
MELKPMIQGNDCSAAGLTLHFKTKKKLGTSVGLASLAVPRKTVVGRNSLTN